MALESMSTGVIQLGHESSASTGPRTMRDAREGCLRDLATTHCLFDGFVELQGRCTELVNQRVPMRENLTASGHVTILRSLSHSRCVSKWSYRSLSPQQVEP